jgi:predicted MFS family arabinose efflux permease
MVGAAGLLGAFVLVELRRSRPMFDLSLLRNRTFVGGLTSAFAISASAFAILTFLVLYFQNVLGDSAIGTGLRLLALTGAIFLTAGVAGRLTSKVPTGMLIGPGFGLIGLGLLLMRGISSSSGWTHLLPGLILAGVGAGLVNVPLASTAVGVVPPSRAGMASGINATFRQVGIAAGVAALGSIFAAQVRTGVISRLSSTPLAHGAHSIAHAISTGHAAQAIAGAPPAVRGQLAAASTSSFVGGLNHILLIAAVVAFCGGGLALALIRQKDFVDASGGTLEALPAGAPATSETRLAA